MEENNKTYWQSFEELAQDPAYLESLNHEFSEGTSEASLDFTDMTRRRFLKLLGASVALATTSCSRPVHKIIPFVKQPEGMKPGVSLYYASTYALNNHSYGILVKTREGRPIKIEGNPDHPLSQGAAGSFGQAAILELYDPNRKRRPLLKDTAVGWPVWDIGVVNTLKNAKVIRILSETTTSPSLENTLQKFLKKFSNAKWYQYEPVSQETVRKTSLQAFGHPNLPAIHVDKAQVILSINSDFLCSELGNQAHVKEWASRRKIRSPKDTMNRLYAAESYFSLTGANADHRLPLKPSELLSFALELAKILVDQYQLSTDSNIKALLHSIPSSHNSYQKEFLMAVAEDLSKHRNQALVLVGQNESVELQVVGHFLNSLIGSFGSTIDSTVSINSFDNGIENIKPLLSELEAGKVDVLITIGGNPVYHLKDLRESLIKVPNHIRLSLYHDETTAVSQYSAPLSHFLESWGDNRSQENIISLVQPTIRPLHESRSAGETLLAWINKLENKSSSPTEDWLNEIKEFWKKQIYPHHSNFVSFETFWENALHDGVVTEKRTTTKYFSFRSESLQTVIKNLDPSPSAQDDKKIELQLTPSPTVYDGRFANSGWLQELPDPVTKITWDNVASMSPKTAQKLRLKQGNLVELSMGANKITLPVFLQPGLSENVITSHSGYGRQASGEIGNHVGANTFALGTDWQYLNIKVKKISGHHKIATTQGHNSMEGRPIVREASLDEYRKNPSFPKEMSEGPLLSLYPAHEYKGHKWGMAIDLNTCVGCSGCVTACMSENNIAIVGKEQVIKGREMQWIRIDRYYEGSDENPKVVQQPMLCQHCENAPCENVCPVAATTHSEEGLNEMTYNRCVGTRYCQNNCPYKVRRFNFFNFNEDIQHPQELGKNPDVTIRMRGVMEKCTFCVQRIQDGKINAKMAGQDRVTDGEIKTACQQSCPTEAIVFGDLNDPTSEVAKLHKQSHGYRVLDELNTKSSIVYLAKIRNPHPRLEKFNA